ncbi:MAG: metal ABC transporter permease [Acidobacteriia bacterium]|nr:metal ABC transporter permease [Terriglobia bacterium]
MSIFEFLLAPFVASLILTGIHAYLGVHVVERGVIFVDLSLAQIAALGTTIAVLFGMEPHSVSTYVVSLIFTFIGAAVFSTIRGHKARIPQEAIIGICYAVASAAAILAMSKSVSETEHLKEMLVGNILTVSWFEVAKTAALYGAIGLFHYTFRKKFLAISMDHQKAEAAGISVRFWDFLFYASFGFVVTSSVAIAGVLLVFCYLIVPSVGAMLYAESIGKRLAIGWTMGTLVSALGVYLSLKIDLPTGATIVCTFALVLILMAAVRPFVKKKGLVNAEPVAVGR